MKKVVGVLVVMVAFAVITSAQTEIEKEKIRAEVGSVIEKQADAWNRGDLEGFMEGYWKSDKMVFISGDNVRRGWQQALDSYKKGYPDKAAMGKLNFSEIEIDVLGKNAALVIGRFTLIREKDKPTGMFTLTLRRFGKDWRIIVDHTS